MKRTKNMIYKETIESVELLLYTENDSFLYHNYIMPVVQSLKKKVVNGIYDTDKAIDAYYHVATAAAKKYKEEFGNDFGSVIFSVTDRFTVAVDLENHYREYLF